jgi:hypothetical protein
MVFISNSFLKAERNIPRKLFLRSRDSPKSFPQVEPG